MTEADGSKFPQMMGSRHLLEQPDVMGDHPVTDTEEECAEPDYTVIPASPLFSRIATNGYQAQVGVTDGHGPAVPRSSATVLGRGAPDKLSTMSGEDSIHENPLIENGQLTWRDANDVRDASWSILRLNREYLESAGALQQSPTDWDFTPDNVPIARKPVTSGFLVSFLVDARGGSMRGSRHPGLRVLVPPSAASAPTRITCRMLRPERTTRPPQLNDSEGLACRIIELGPHPCSFNSPVLLEIPHFAALCGRQRELVVLRSDNGEVWREHSLEATDQAVQSAFGQTFDTLETMEELREKRIIRILTNDFPQYLAVVSRLRQETAMVGSDGGVLSSTVVPQVQAVFPEGALQKRIRVGLQAHPIPTELVSRLLGNRVAVSPIVTLEPRRRKFHKPITLTIPLPKTAMRGMLNPTTTDSKTPSAPSLRLLCSITGGTLPAQWEDITGSTPLSKVKDCVSFTTTVSARFWLMDCQSIHESTEMAGHLYREACLVSYMGKLVIFAKRIDVDEALIRCLCVTDDRVDKTLECQEGFEVCAASPEVEVAEGRPVWLEAAGNLLPMTKSGEQLSLQFHAFRENRLAFPVRVRDIQADPVGKFAFMREPRRALGSDTSQSMQRPICTLEVHIGAETGGKTGTSSMAEVGLLSLSAHLNTPAAASAQSIPCVFPKQQLDQSDDRGLGDSHDRLASLNAEDIIARSQLDLLQVASEVGGDWPKLVGVLLPDSRLDATCTVEQLVNWITQNEPQWVEARSSSPPPAGGLGGLTVADLRTDHDQALAVLLAWKQHKGDAATGNELNRALRSIGRVDVVKSCMRDIQCVLEEEERTEASKLLNKTASSDQAQLTPPVPTSTSLVGTGTMMSEMEDIPVHEFHSALMAEKPLSTDVDATTQETTADREFVSHDVEEPSPPADEERQSIPEGTADWSGVHISESEEPSDQKAMEGVTDDAEEEHWQSGSPPVTTTSQLGGDPMLDRAVQDMLSATDDADLVRESESMSASMEEPFEPEQEVPEVAESQSAEPPASSSITDTPPGTADHEPKQEETFAQEDITASPVEDSQTAQQSDMKDSPAVTGYDAPAQEPTPEEGTSVEQPPALHLAGGDTLHSELPVEAAEAQCNAASGQLEEGSPNSPTASQSGAHDEQVDISPREGMRDADQ
ncbi:unnamed protein product [Dicrocoelium dendriticum]|nr:unnamed protein product [Dicrocoelium dendriticum]